MGRLLNFKKTRFWTLIVVSIMIIALATGCLNNSPEEDAYNEVVSESNNEQSSDPAEEPAEEPVEDPSDEPEEEPADDPVEEPSDEPSPVSKGHHTGYISKLDLDKNLIYIDMVEFLTYEDEERLIELGVDMDYEMIADFYIHDGDSDITSLEVADTTEYLVLDWEQIPNQISMTKKEFSEYNEGAIHNPLYHIYTKDGYISKIEEQYIP